MSTSGSLVSVAVVLLTSLFAASSPADDDPVPYGWKQLTTDGYFKQRPVWSPDGEQLLFTRNLGESIQVIVCDADGTHEKRLFENQYPRMDAVFAPNGKRIAFTWDKVSPGQGDMELYLSDADGENPTPLFVSEGKLSHEEWASWSPDSAWLACTSTRHENAELFLIKADGSERQRLTSDPALDVHPSFSPDGRRIAFATNRWGDLEIAIYHLDTSLITRLTESPGLDDYPAWSPDGKHLAFTSRREGNLEIFLMNADGSNPQNLTHTDGPDNFASWTPIGDVTFCSYLNGAWDIYQLKPGTQ